MSFYLSDDNAVFESSGFFLDGVFLHYAKFFSDMFFLIDRFAYL